MNRLAGLAIVSVALPLLAIGAEPIYISRCDHGERRQIIAVPSDRAVLVEPKKGPAILIWISTLNLAEATYRWRLVSPQQTNFSGEGRVFQDLHHPMIKLPDDQIPKRKNSGSNRHIFAGNIALEWSGTRSISLIVYCPSLATARLVDFTR